MVSSDSDDILQTAVQYAGNKISIHKRPAEFATKERPVLDAMLAILEKNQDFDAFAYFLPTCPFRNEVHIKEGFALLEGHIDSVVSVVGYGEPIQLAGKLDEHKMFHPKFNNLVTGKTNSLFMTKYYRPNGGFYIARSKTLMKKRNFFIGPVKGYEMSKVHSHDINDFFDIKMAELIIQAGLLNDS